MDRCLLLTARRYDFADSETGRRVVGVTLTYLTGEVEDQADFRGQAPLSIKAPSDVWGQLEAVPGFYGIEFRQRPGPRGRPTLQATGLQFLSGVDFDAVDSVASAIATPHPLRSE